MEIRNLRDAQVFTAAWRTETAPGRPYSYMNADRYIAEAAEGLTRSLSIMEAAPGRYGQGQRDDIREAVEYLQKERATCPAST